MALQNVKYQVTKKVRVVFEWSYFCRIGVVKVVLMTTYLYIPFKPHSPSRVVQRITLFAISFVGNESFKEHVFDKRYFEIYFSVQVQIRKTSNRGRQKNILSVQRDFSERVNGPLKSRSADFPLGTRISKTSPVLVMHPPQTKPS